MTNLCGLSEEQAMASANAAISPLRLRKVREDFGRDDKFVGLEIKRAASRLPVV
jgi:hypothetical protein